jgi:hypothetical protein
MTEDPIRDVVTRLSRPHRSGGSVIERAAILAEGSGSGAILAWISAHDGAPEEAAAARAPARGLHSARRDDTDAARASTPQRYVLPPGVLR